MEHLLPIRNRCLDRPRHDSAPRRRSALPHEFEALDRSWERAWESDQDYSDVYTASGATVITCKTVIDKARHPIVASYDAKNQPVGIHVDFGVLGASQAALRNSRGRLRRWGAAAGRLLRRK